MIDTIYKTLLTILNKENQGYVSPTEFNLMANNVQQEIFREYFEDVNRDKIKEVKGLSNKGHANLALNQKQRIDQFAEKIKLTVTDGEVALPENLYFIDDDGVVTKTGKVVEEMEKGQSNYLFNTEVAPTLTYPAYERYQDRLVLFPNNGIEEVTINYTRTPSAPNWTYVIVNNKELYNPSNNSFQDFELHPSEFTNIVLRMLAMFGINIREGEIVQIAEQLKDKMNLKDNN